MRDGSTRRPRTSPPRRTWTPERVQVHDWRRHGRLDDLGTFAEGASGLPWSRALFHALLEELHIGDDFDGLVGRVAYRPASQYPRLLAIALLLRHSWCPQDLERTATRLGLLRVIEPIASTTRPQPPTTRDGGNRRRTGARHTAPRAACSCPLKGIRHVERIIHADALTRSPRTRTRLRVSSPPRP